MSKGTGGDRWPPGKPGAWGLQFPLCSELVQITFIERVFRGFGISLGPGSDDARQERLSNGHDGLPGKGSQDKRRTWPSQHSAGRPRGVSWLSGPALPEGLPPI